jgi:hypothetical protein
LINPTVGVRPAAPYFGIGLPSMPNPGDVNFNQITDNVEWMSRRTHDAFSPPYSWMMQLGMDWYGLQHPWVFNYWNTPSKV